MVGTENNESMETPVPAPPTGPAGGEPVGLWRPWSGVHADVCGG